MAVRWFARRLLEGAVTPLPGIHTAGTTSAAAAKSKAQAQDAETLPLRVAPSLITGRALDKRVVLLVEALLHPPEPAAAPVVSLARLRAVKAKHPGYLLAELAAWVTPEQQAAFVAKWPAVSAT
jgi:hypothetical protein